MVYQERRLKVYVAASYPHRDTLALKMCKLVEANGFECCSRWIKEHEPDLSLNGNLGNRTIEQRRKYSRIDVDDVNCCDILIIISDKLPGVNYQNVRGGKHVETGMAIGQGKHVILVGEPENIFHHLDTIKQVDSLKAAVQACIDYRDRKKIALL